MKLSSISIFFAMFQISLSSKVKLEPKSEPADGTIDLEDNFIDVGNEDEMNRRTELGDDPEDDIPEPEKSKPKPKRQFSEPRKRRKNSVAVKKVQMSENGKKFSFSINQIMTNILYSFSLSSELKKIVFKSNISLKS